VLGPNAGSSCDANGVNVTFPAPGGDGASLDCFPSGGKNVSGSGLMINLDQTTGASTLTAAIPCGFGNAARCHCGLCSNDLTIPCSSNAACGAGTCQKRANFDPLPNQCDTSCTQVPGTQEGQCDGPTDAGCDAIVKANGEAFIACTTNADCDPANIGIPAGNCTASKRRECFLPSIVATGKADPTFPVGVATFCVPPTANLGINSTAGLPGPGRVSTQGATRGLCATGDYVPGSGCPG
jgi:hypothetical protein